MTETTAITIEPWRPDLRPGDDGSHDADIAAIARLITELGYPTDVPTQRARLARRMAIREAISIDLLVARDRGAIVGLASVAALDIDLDEGETVELRALVVLQERRGERIGEQLVLAAEAWAREHGATVLTLRTNVTRTDAHRFYERLGFVQTKTSRTYRITL
ncbi:MAG: GNAT family N-acetyltransferase [Thermomicrobiales bacterium]